MPAMLNLPLHLLTPFVALFAVLLIAQRLGPRLLPHAGWFSRISLSLLCIVSLQSLVQTVWFYSGLLLNSSSDLWTLLVTLALCSPTLFIKQPLPHDAVEKNPWTLHRIICAGIILIAAIITWVIVLSNASSASTADSIRTPWPFLSHGTLLAIGLLWLATLLMGWLAHSPAFSAMIASLALSATTSITPLLYRIGFGFDGFLHIATEKIILATGTLSPKPLYYIGQYVFTTWLSRITDLPIDAVDRWLVPIAAGLLLPFALYLSRPKHNSSTIAFSLALLPVGFFVATTPQAFAYLLGLTALILAYDTDRHVHPIAPIVIALWGVAAHPLAGVPLFCVVFALCCVRVPHIATRILAILGVIAAAISIPLLFIVLSRISSTTTILWDTTPLTTLAPWRELTTQLLPLTKNVFALWPGWATLITRSLPVVLILLSIATIIRSRHARWQPSLLLASAILLFIVGAALKTAGDFAFLIDYERGNYADRLRILATLCLLPAAFPTPAFLTDRARRSQPLVATSCIVTCLMCAAAFSYDALPRHDAVVTGHGWSVGASDIDAVRAIDRDSVGRTYTVLANQSVSAAAVSQFGFKRYNGDVFFYPIPTGGPLYDLFLRMTYNEPSRDTAKDAATLGGSDLVYVVLNDYWWNATNLTESLSAIANQSWVFGDPNLGIGKSVRVYKFDLSTASSASTTRSGS